MNISYAATTLGGEGRRGNQVLCPGPGHSKADRSLLVIFEGKEFRVHSFAGDDWKMCRDYVRDRLGLSHQPAQSAGNRPVTQTPSLPDVDQEGRIRSALDIWAQAKGLDGTPGAKYLASRGVKYSGAALRWHPNCPFGKGQKVGCMVALVRNIATDEPQGIHRTAIGCDGCKLSSLGSNGRLTLGSLTNGAIKLHDLTGDVLAIGEGIETSLSIRELPDLENMPVWSLLNAGQLAQFPVLQGLSSLWVAVDNDTAGKMSANSVVSRMTAGGIETILLQPNAEGKDLNDLIGGHNGKS